MNKGAIRWIIFCTGLSLVGLVIFQVSWIDSIVTANEEAFERDVQDVLSDVAEKLEKKEALEVAVENFHTDFIYKSLSNSDSNKIELIESTFEKKVIEVKDYVHDSVTRPEWVSFYFSSGEENSGLEDVFIELRDDQERAHEPGLLRGEVDTILSTRTAYKQRIKSIAKKSEYVQLAMHELFTKEKPLQERLDVDQLDSLIRVGLLGRGVELKYNFAVYDPYKEALVAANFEGNFQEVLDSDLRANLFPNDIVGEAGFLAVRFPNQNGYILRKAWVTLISSVVFILIILGSFSYAILTIFKQKKLSEVKNDFINNMTHEFKTPISTISLACEALRDNDIKSTKALEEKYLGIIQEENKRLGQQVEKVLQMAVIDRKDIELKPEMIDVHKVIKNIVENISIQVSKKGGKVSMKLGAVKHTAFADRMHLTNIIYNLVDNANKYSLENPVIKISTTDTKNGIQIDVEDKGIGISNEGLKKVFEKFYRVPTGNLHDVKGFGLGLAYVKSMIEAHGGEITASSELKKGSVFTILLPYEIQKMAI